MYKIVLTIFFLSVAFTAAAQQGRYSETVDKKSYDLFMKSNWDELREVGTAAIESGIDFYFLRMRLGISYYEEKNYISSIPHFEKAVDYSPKDSISQEYLYYAYLFSGQESEANLLSKKFSSQLKRKINYKQPDFFKGAYTEGGYSFNADYKDTKNNSFKGNQDLSGTQKVFKDETYINLSLLHSIGERVSVFHGYNNIVVNSTQQFEDGVNGKKEYKSSVKQNEYYINLGFYLGKGFNLTTAFHYLNVKVEEYQPPANNGQGFSNTVSNTNDNVFNVSLSKRLGHTELGLTTVFGNLNGGKQMQNSFTFIWYPFGNMNLYNVSNFIFHSDKLGPGKPVTRVLFDEKLGFKIASKLWAEAIFTSGPIFNYSESNAFIIYNNVDKIKYKAGFNLISPVSDNIELSFRYLFLPLEYDVTTTNTSNVSTTKTNNLLTHKIIGGIKWTF